MQETGCDQEHQAGGGRRRTTSVLKARLKAFAKRVPAIRKLAKVGISSAALVRTAGNPVALYGVDTVGIGEAHLLKLRRLAARAITNDPAGKCIEAALHLADANRSGVDPAHMAAVLPIGAWALACWEKWQPLERLNW